MTVNKVPTALSKIFALFQNQMNDGLNRLKEVIASTS